MATLTYDPTPADEPEFNEAEQEALAIGEAQAEAENQMLAGKFKDAEALEQAYIELQKKLGQNETDEEIEGELQGEGDETEEVDEPYEEDDPELEAITSLLNDASDEFAANGELSEETIDELIKLDSADLLAAYMDLQNGGAQPDLSDADVATVFDFVGGEQQYNELIGWASDSLDPQLINAFDGIVDSGDVVAIQLAVAGLSSAYQEANGYEGRMLSGKPAQSTPDAGFRSQAEVVQAMNDPRYDSDPAYRQDVFERLAASNLEY